jgi:hypothetical protein
MSKHGVPAQGGPPGRPAARGRDGHSEPMAGRHRAVGTAGRDPFAESLGEMLRSKVVGVGAGGPPPGGLARVRRKALARRRTRAVLAGGAGALAFAAVVAVAAGNHFDLVPSLTGAAGPGAVSGPGTHASVPAVGQRASGAFNDGRMLGPNSAAGKTGPAIGPGRPVTAVPPAVSAARLPLCSAATVVVTATVDLTVGAVAYGHVDALALSACVAVGPPVLTVTNQAGDAAASVRILRADTTLASALPQVTTWGALMLLSPGQGYQFQFAWAASQCSQAVGTPSPSASAPPNHIEYSLGYAVAGTTPNAVVPLRAPCGAQVFVTDIYRPGAYLLPKTPSPTLSHIPAGGSSPSPDPAPPSASSSPSIASSLPPSTTTSPTAVRSSAGGAVNGTVVASSHATAR